MCEVQVRNVGEGFTVEVLFELICVGECSSEGVATHSKQKSFCRGVEG